MLVLLNGHEAVVGEPGSYVTLDRKWTTGDAISFVLPMGFRVTRYYGSEPGFQNGAHYALEYGPVLMALVGMGEAIEGVKVAVEPQNLPQALRAIPGRPLHFALAGSRLKYQPYWEVQDEPFTCFPVVQKT